ncbi:MAG: hypothetical protein AAB372_04455 [Patescibacteria group bacterium]
MAANNKQRQTILIGVLILTLALAGAWFFFLNNSDSSDQGAVALPTNSTGAKNERVQKILAAVVRVGTINLDTQFFENPKFTALQETPIDIPQVQPIRGRTLENLLKPTRAKEGNKR